MNQSPHFVSESKSNFPVFHEYGFDAFCYNAYGCKVLHDNFYHLKYDDDHLSPPPPSDEKKMRRMVAGYIPSSPPFPDPVKVNWRSLDGVAHEATLDLDEIFKGHRLLYKTPKNIIDQVTEPHIIVEVDNKTINVYMRTMIFLKEGNGKKFDDDLILAYTHTY